MQYFKCFNPDMGDISQNIWLADKEIEVKIPAHGFGVFEEDVARAIHVMRPALEVVQVSSKEYDEYRKRIAGADKVLGAKKSKGKGK
jgi:hypothetical protein